MSETVIPQTTESAPAPAPLPKRERPAHRDANVLRWLAAYTMSMVGDSVYYTALAWAAARSGSPTQAGVVLAVGAVPRAVLMLGGECSPTGGARAGSSSAATPRAAW